MVFPSEGEGTNIIKIDTSVVNILKNFFRDFAGQSQGHILQCDNNTRLLSRFVKLKCVMLHGYVMFGKEFVSRYAV